ncbi:MAG: 1-acyl-sn-glycerol-3-phosphate acyltransferase [Rhizobacter sp.]|nr:1-acyl-sn-glycerol-3-phosphate acyltransferase [Bacteriovorax sp.]
MEKALKYILHLILFKIILKNFLRLFVGISFPKSSDLENIPQCIYVANHNSHMDTAAFLAMIPMKGHLDAHPIAASDYFGRSAFARKFFEFVFNTILIDRKGKQEVDKTIAPINDALAKNKSILLFPEGSRGEPEVMGQFKNGISYILKAHPTIPFVPIYMQGLGKAMPKGDSVIIPHDSKIIVGKPVLIPDVVNLPVQEITEIVRQKILELENRTN